MGDAGMTPENYPDPLDGWFVVNTSDEEARHEGEWTAPDEAIRNLVYAALMAVILVVALVAAALIYVWFASHPLAL